MTMTDLSITEIEHFVESRVWKMIVEQSLTMVSTAMEENNNTDPFKDPSKICRNQGIVEAAGRIVDYPAILKEQVEFEIKQEEKE
jgi:hypothetical protein